MLTPLKFKPGIVKDLTRYANETGWFDSNWVRFRMSLPEKMGGWQKYSTSTFLGICRALINWTILSGRQYFGLGTNLKYYINSGSGSYTDITPIRRTVTLAADPFATTIGSTTVTVTDAGHGAVLNDFVTFSGATSFSGIPAGDFNQEHQITGIINGSSYTITVDTAGQIVASGGGAAVEAEYQINVGLANSVPGVGWGAGTWGHDTWGSDATDGISQNLRLWSHDNYGEDLIANVRNGNIYYWDATTPLARMVPLEDIPAASDAPVVATIIMVSSEERHVLAFGTNPIGSATQDPLFIRWSATEDAADWTPTVINTAGGYRLSVGTKIVAVLEGRAETLIYTDVAIYQMRWTGAPFVFSFVQIGTNIAIISPNAAVALGDVSFWMGHNQFYSYNGRIQIMNCPVADYVFSRLTMAQSQKIYAFSNSHFDEVGWLYPGDSDECDSYVIYSIRENVWYTGSLNRTAWIDRGPSYLPVATSEDGYLYDHEYGYDDGSTNPPSPITAYIESSPMEAPNGEQFMFINRFIPDVTFRDSSAANPSVDMTFTMQNYPGGSLTQNYSKTVTQTSTVTVEQFTEQCFIRLRGRSASFRCESNDLGVAWRLGVVRADIRSDGRR